MNRQRHPNSHDQATTHTDNRAEVQSVCHVQKHFSSSQAFMLNISGGAWPLSGSASFSAVVGSDLPS